MPTITRLRQDGLSIGQLARRTGVNVETIRYYERIGMLTGPPRTASGHRVYGSDDVRTLAFIRRARQIGFPLADVRRLLALRTAGPSCCAEARHIALRHLEGVRAKIADLSGLARLLEQATSQNPTGVALCCPVMDLLDPRGHALLESASSGTTIEAPLARPVATQRA